MKATITIDLEEPRHYNLGTPVEFPTDGFVQSVERLLADLARFKSRAVFFIVGETAQAYPDIVRQIARAGHEVAAHSMRHQLVTDMTEAEFRADALECKNLLEKLSGASVRGYRAPSWSAHTKKTPWFWKILREAGYTYSSSVIPFRTFLYGESGLALTKIEVEEPFWPRTLRGFVREVPEIPVSTVSLFGKEIPFSGGFYFRMLPWVFIRGAANKNFAPIFYFHLRDVGLEKIPAHMRASLRFIQYGHRGAGRKKFLRLLSEM